MENITIKDIVEACSGQLLCGDENKVIKEFSIDSRSGSEDSIFVPIIGERVDAHKFIDGALKINGATFTSEHDEPLEGFENKPWRYSGSDAEGRDFLQKSYESSCCCSYRKCW